MFYRGNKAHLFQRRERYQSFSRLLLAKLGKQRLQVFRVPAAGLKLPVHRDDLTAHGSDKLFLFVLQRGAPAQGLHQRGLLGHGPAPPGAAR